MDRHRGAGRHAQGRDRQAQRAIKTALGGELGRQLAETSLVPVGDSPEAFREFLRKDAQGYEALVKAAHITPQ